MTTKRPLRTVGAVALCSVLVAVAACTNRSDDPLDYAETTMLTGADIGADDLAGVKLIGDIGLVATTDHSGGRLAAIDLTTGRTIWSADDGDPILGGDSAVVDLSSPHDACGTRRPRPRQG
jgi:outer membrane protein assembly factor BamB